MKTKILITTLTIVVAASMAPNTARASMMCQHDWLAAWRTAISGGEALNGLTQGYTATSNNISGLGTWAISATTGNAGRQSVTGISGCYSSNSSPPTNNPMADIHGSNCWCRMMTPMIGSWVLSGTGSNPFCGITCPQECSSLATTPLLNLPGRRGLLVQLFTPM